MGSSKVEFRIRVKATTHLKDESGSLFLFRRPMNFPISDVIYPGLSSLFQNMTNQLIELERHFNGLELNKFGGNEESQASERALQRKFGYSRYFQSFFSGS